MADTEKIVQKIAAGNEQLETSEREGLQVVIAMDAGRLSITEGLTAIDEAVGHFSEARKRLEEADQHTVGTQNGIYRAEGEFDAAGVQSSSDDFAKKILPILRNEREGDFEKLRDVLEKDRLAIGRIVRALTDIKTDGEKLPTAYEKNKENVTEYAAERSPWYRSKMDAWAKAVVQASGE